MVGVRTTRCCVTRHESLMGGKKRKVILQVKELCLVEVYYVGKTGLHID